MSIAESIKKARERGATDEQIIQEIIKQNPEKGEKIKELLKKGVNPSQILNKILETKPKPKTEIKKEIKPKKETIKMTTPPPEVKPVPPKARPVPPEVKLEKKPEELKTKPSPLVESFEKEREKEIELAKKRIKELKKKLEEKRKETFAPSKIFPKAEKPAPQKPFRPIIRPLPKKPTTREKIWTRVLVFSIVLIFLAGIASFWYWYLVVRPQPPIGCQSDADCPEGFVCGANGVCIEKKPIQQCQKDTDCPEGFICGENKTCVKKPTEIVVPTSLIPIDIEREITISSLDEIPPLLSQIVQEWVEKNQFKRVIIKDIKRNKVIGLKEFFDALQIRVPTGFYQTVKDNFTLFVYSQWQGNRIGLIAEVLNKEELKNLLSSQENTMKDDLKPLINLIGETIPLSYVSYFRNSSQYPGYVGPNFRYLTLSKNDLGICYLVSNYYLVLTSSWESMRKVVEKLNIPGDVIEITKELKFGDKDYQVKLLQTWLKQDASIYPSGKVTGWFGPLTRAAVIRFQEKYASEILAPQGLSKGTGVVDEYTRIKLNELYAQSGIIPPVREITTDLRYGSHGDEVRLLQSWLAKDKDVYPQGIVSGWFGPLTRAAVIRFQEKYASEILAPQGLSKGTGVVDALTRKKLNELYKNITF